MTVKACAKSKGGSIVGIVYGILELFMFLTTTTTIISFGALRKTIYYKYSAQFFVNFMTIMVPQNRDSNIFKQNQQLLEKTRISYIHTSKINVQLTMQKQRFYWSDLKQLSIEYFKQSAFAVGPHV